MTFTWAWAGAVSLACSLCTCSAFVAHHVQIFASLTSAARRCDDANCFSGSKVLSAECPEQVLRGPYVVRELYLYLAISGAIHGALAWQNSKSVVGLPCQSGACPFHTRSTVCDTSSSDMIPKSTLPSTVGVLDATHNLWSLTITKGTDGRKPKARQNSTACTSLRLSPVRRNCLVRYQ